NHHRRKAMRHYFSWKQIELLFSDERKREEVLHQCRVLSIVSIGLVDCLLVERAFRIFVNRSKILRLLSRSVHIKALIARDSCFLTRDHERAERHTKKKKPDDGWPHRFAPPALFLITPPQPRYRSLVSSV